MSEESSDIPPQARAFISYSWSSPTHESWVIGLAQRLMEDGIDVILDKWDLKPGHDAHVFMEKMVTDPSVTKVLMICDKVYVEKANDRSGGVGTESQIISPELYAKDSSAQNKFAAVVVELDETGKEYVPVFYKGRIHFDFTTSDRSEIHYDELLRWLANKPRYIKPSVGKLPTSILGNIAPTTATGSRAKRAEEALRQGQTNATGLLREYADALVVQMPEHTFVLPDGVEFDDQIVYQVDALRPYVIEFQSLITTLARYDFDARNFETILACLERIAGFMHRPEDVTSWNRLQFDHYKIFVHELFLSMFAVLLKEERFDLAELQLNRAYLIRSDSNGVGRASKDFWDFQEFPETLEIRNRRLKLNRVSLHADMISEWYKGHAISLDDIMQADFVLWLSPKTRPTPSWYGWHPVSLVWGSRRYSPFDIFARSESKSFFSKISRLLRVTSADEFKTLLEKIDGGEGALKFDYSRVSSSRLANAENLAVLD